MKKMNIQLFGGRGANSGYSGGRSTSGNRGASKFYDKTSKYQGMTMHEFENAIRDKKYENIGIFDKDGKLIIAGTSYNKGSVAIPSNHPDFNKMHDLTHNHPYQDGRVIGGSFSEADIQNHLRFNIPGMTRAVSNGPNENTYIFRAKNGAKTDINGMATAANKAGRQYADKAQRAVDAVRAKLAAQGKSLNGRSNQVYIGTMKRIWKETNVEKYGYEYIEIKKPKW